MASGTASLISILSPIAKGRIWAAPVEAARIVGRRVGHHPRRTAGKMPWMKTAGWVFLIALLAVPTIVTDGPAAIASGGHALSVWIAEIGWFVIFVAIGLAVVRRPAKKPPEPPPDEHRPPSQS
jgi:hypothetical protein